MTLFGVMDLLPPRSVRIPTLWNDNCLEGKDARQIAFYAAYASCWWHWRTDKAEQLGDKDDPRNEYKRTPRDENGIKNPIPLLQCAKWNMVFRRACKEACGHV